ncbi:MAG TPA: 3-keto-5-aminohexanoate cleavage protein, partial [Acidimicrobiales bacterium]|nr:3-keto-5-aminohexanoate cleavage protein [Acidimicrobiales bacterium]
MLAGVEWAPPPLCPYEPLIVNVALTGAVPRTGDNPAVPVTPEQIVRDAIACAEAGASMVHIHVRDDNEDPIHDRTRYAQVIEGIRNIVPELVIGVTTTGRAGSHDVASRAVGVDLPGALRPDMASLTLGSFNFPNVISHNPPDIIVGLLERMNERGIKPELEVFEAGMVNTALLLASRGLLASPPYFNILLGSMGSAPAFVATLAHIVERLPQDAVWAAAGIGMFQRQMVMAATVMGGNVRTGLEDAPRPTGDTPQTNRSAVEFAVEVARLLGRDI